MRLMGSRAAPLRGAKQTDGRTTTGSGWRRRWRQERGGGLVEFALILPLLSSLVLGSITGGAAYHKKITMTGAVREGARFGATLNNASDFATKVRDRVVGLAPSELTNDDVCVELVRAGSPETVAHSWYPHGGSFCPSTFGTTPPTPATTAGYCVVKVWAHRFSRLEAMFFNTDIDLQAKAVAAYERGNPPGVC